MIVGVPYDAEIEYMESTGEQWIDTVIVPTTNTSIQCEFGVLVELNEFVFGSEVDRGSNAFALLVRTNGTNAVEFGGAKTFSYTYQSGERISFRLDKSSAHYNNVEVATGGTITGNTYPIYLFASNRAGTVTQCSHIKLARVKIYNDSTIIRDLIPVRVGQVGYMYDRVSKKLFGNQGTGSFVLGPDVAKPVMGIWRYRDNYFASDYIRDGLVAMWDGLETGGFGITQFGQSNFSWVNLATGEPLATNQNTVAYEDGVGVEAVFGFSARPFSMPENSASWTIEYVALFYGPDSNGRSSFIRSDNTDSYYYPTFLGPDTSQATIMIAGGYSYQTVLTVPVASDYRESATIVRDNSGHRTVIRCNGIEATGNGNPNITVFPSSSFTFVDRRSDLGYPARLHCVRAYNRALTADEIAYNYSIDKVRFNLP